MKYDCLVLHSLYLMNDADKMFPICLYSCSWINVNIFEMFNTSFNLCHDLGQTFDRGLALNAEGRYLQVHKEILSGLN